MHVLDPDGIQQSIRRAKAHQQSVWRRLRTMADGELLQWMKHRAPPGARWMGYNGKVLLFRVSEDGDRLIDVYRQHAERQRDLDDILELL